MKSLVYKLLNTLNIFLPKRHAAILLYHDIGDSDLYLTVALENFKAQMEYLYINGYNVISLKELGKVLRMNGDVRPKTVVLTFDDGFKSHYSSVFPILKKYNFPGTFFIATDFIGDVISNSEQKPQPVMNEDELKDLNQSTRAEIEPHTLSHKEMPSLNLGEKKREVVRSKEYFEALFGKTCTVFAYPRGAYDQETVRVTRDAGFQTAVTVREGVVQKGDNPLVLSRNTINRDTDLAEFKTKLGYSSKFIPLLSFFKRI